MKSNCDENEKNTLSPDSLPAGSDVNRVIPQDIKVPVSNPESSKKPGHSLRVGSRDIEGRPSDFPFTVRKPCKEHVDPKELLPRISKVILRFVVVSQDQADAAALWIAHTYLVKLFDHSPIAIINAPERACAKTLFQDVLARLSCKSLSVANVTASSMFRSVDLWMPTLFFDEADTFFKDKQDLQGMVNAGHNKNGFVLRSELEQDSYMPRKFSVFCAKSIAGIALERHLPDATMSRGIIFNMRRKLSDEQVERLRYAEPGLFDGIASELERFAQDYALRILEARPPLPNALNDRQQDNWEPLLAIAMCISDEWLQKATDIALKLSKGSNDYVSTGNELLSDIQSIFESRVQEGQYADKLSTQALIDALIKIEDGPWARYHNGTPLTPRALAKQLAHYGIKPKTVRIGRFDTPKGYDLQQFKDAFARYVTKPEPESIESVDDLGEDDTSDLY